MEFNEKLQELRKQKGLTQEELSEALFVSRTAISKWESGRGYPGIDSLKATAKFFGVTIDELLSGNELLNIAEEDSKKKESHFRGMIFGLLDCFVAMLFFLPFFGQETDGIIQEVALVKLSGTMPYLKAVYFTIVSVIVLFGILTLALQNCQKVLWVKTGGKISLVLNILGVLLFMVSLQPYAAVFLFAFMIIKCLTLIKWQ